MLFSLFGCNCKRNFIVLCESHGMQCFSFVHRWLCGSSLHAQWESSFDCIGGPSACFVRIRSIKRIECTCHKQNAIRVECANPSAKRVSNVYALVGMPLRLCDLVQPECHHYHHRRLHHRRRDDIMQSSHGFRAAIACWQSITDMVFVLRELPHRGRVIILCGQRGTDAMVSGRQRRQRRRPRQTR